MDDANFNPAEIKILIPMIRESVKRLKKKINELAAIGKEKEAAKKKKASFQGVFDDVLLDLKKEINSSGAEIISEFSDAPMVNLSKKNLKSILQNLLSNAIKYRMQERKLKIHVKTERAGDDYILLKVRDNGCGIEEKDKVRIFRMYHRALTHIEGTGVGLGIVKKIVKNSGGKIGLDSKVGEGSVFKIYFRR